MSPCSQPPPCTYLPTLTIKISPLANLATHLLAVRERLRHAAATDTTGRPPGGVDVEQAPEDPVVKPASERTAAAARSCAKIIESLSLQNWLTVALLLRLCGPSLSHLATQVMVQAKQLSAALAVRSLDRTTSRLRVAFFTIVHTFISRSFAAMATSRITIHTNLDVADGTVTPTTTAPPHPSDEASDAARSD